MNDQTPDPALNPRARARRPADDNVVDLLGRLTHQGAHLAQEQVHLMQAEVREATHDIKQAVGAFAGAAVVGIAGLGVLLMGLGYLIGYLIENVPAGVLIVGAAALVVAAIMASSARKKMAAAHLRPDRTIRTAQDTPDALTGHAASTGGHNDR